jgi:hypothetical protein
MTTIAPRLDPLHVVGVIALFDVLGVAILCGYR